MNDLESIATTVPYMVCPGNHEFNFNFSAFTHRFNGMPHSDTPIMRSAGPNVAGKRNNWWYSYDIANVHVISLNSGVVTAPMEVTNTSRYRWNYPTDLQEAQYHWLAADLAAAAKNRESVPWVVVYAHYPMYCSQDSPDCTTQAGYMRNGIP